MNRELFVHVDVDGAAVPCGRLRTRALPREGASFEYDARWRESPRGFAIEPALPLGPAPFHTKSPLFRAFADACPDRWGRTLLRRAERARARREGRAPRTLAEVDFLVGVDDRTRLGALRLSDTGSPGAFLADGSHPIAPVLALARLLAASARVLSETETDEDLALLLAPGTSLGGARPKATVIDARGQFHVAKLPRRDDDWPVTRWEAATLALARAAGIRVPPCRLDVVAKKPVLVIARFDRRGGVRVPFMSALTAVGADDGETRSYLDVADAIRQHGSLATADLAELWRRMVFNVLVSNTDDHLRNHGFLHDGPGWRLAPAYDLNPVPVDVRPRIHALCLDEDDTRASIDTVMAVAPRFGVVRRDALSIAREVAVSVRSWRKVGARHGIRPREIDRMASAFEHDDLQAVPR